MISNNQNKAPVTRTTSKPEGSGAPATVTFKPTKDNSQPQEFQMSSVVEQLDKTASGESQNNSEVAILQQKAQYSYQDYMKERQELLGPKKKDQKVSCM